MSVKVVIGTQWGDEGKGKIVDCLTQNTDQVVRFQGGNNAGHTLIVDQKKTVLHLIPSGILQGHAQCVIARGVVVDPAVLLVELNTLKERGLLDRAQRLLISYHSHLIFPYHKIIDGLREQDQKQKKIGTTGRGIGPCYEDKIARRGIFWLDFLLKDRFVEKLKANLAYYNPIITKIYGEQALDFDPIYESYSQYYQEIKPYLANTDQAIDQAIQNNKKVLFEGAQGSLLDNDYGTYPYVTSSNTVSSQASLGSGIAPQNIADVLGILKAYTTRVGEGPFPTELFDQTGQLLQTRGGEIGATTGRNRRCGWLDLVLVKKACQINGVTHLIITKLDVLSGLANLKVCVGYQNPQTQTQEPDTDLVDLENIEPIYQEFEGWQEDISNLRNFDELPANAKKYLKFIADYLKTPLFLISVGPERKANIVL